MFEDHARLVGPSNNILWQCQGYQVQILAFWLLTNILSISVTLATYTAYLKQIFGQYQDGNSW